MSTKLEEEIRDRLSLKRLAKDANSVAGGCISGAQTYSIDNDKRIFVKTNSSLNAHIMFEGERESLKAIIATNIIKAPEPLLVLHDYDETRSSAIVMEHVNLSSLTKEGATLLGRSMANLHDYNNKVIKYKKRAIRWIGGKPPSARSIEEAKARAVDRESGKSGSDDEDDNDEDEHLQFTKHATSKIRSMNLNDKIIEASDKPFADKFVPEPNADEEITQFGFDIPTSCGSIPQINEWADDWVSFYARHRLDKAIRSILSDYGDRELTQLWSQFQLKIGKFFSDYDIRSGDKIVPSLLHGDLWSGNVGQTVMDDQTSTCCPVVYDPSSFYGHSEYEFGIARMFGGIPKAFELGYFEQLPKRKHFEDRNKLYQLFHHLNHWDHFGSGYRPGSLKLLKDLNAMAICQ